jgi:hypothetical protein
MFFRKANDIVCYRIVETPRGREGIDGLRKMERMMEQEEFGIVYHRLLLRAIRVAVMTPLASQSERRELSAGEPLQASLFSLKHYL